MSIQDQPWYCPITKEPPTCHESTEAEIVRYIIDENYQMAEHVLLNSNLPNDIAMRVLDKLINCTSS